MEVRKKDLDFENSGEERGKVAEWGLEGEDGMLMR